MIGPLQDHVFLRKLESFTPLSRIYPHFFSPAEITTLSERFHSFDVLNRHIVFLSMENFFSSLGGLGTIIKYLPRRIADTGEQVTFLTPFHRGNEQVRKGLAEGRLEPHAVKRHFSIGGFAGTFSLYKQNDAPVPAYYIDCSGFFGAVHDPYAYDDQHDLVRDALAFSALVPFALRELGLSHNVTVHANDWETAPAALTTKLAMAAGVVHSVKTVLTLHNSFDARLGEADAAHFFGRPAVGHTVLTASIPFMDAPLTTVSVQFSRDLMVDPLQRWLFAPHLAPVFSKNPPIGIDNGLFGHPTSIFTDEARAAASEGHFQKILREKAAARAAFLAGIAEIDDPRVVGSLHFGPREKNIPIFFMSGRFDLSQKGFDLVFHALRKIGKGKMKLVFSPSTPTARQAESFAFFADIAREFPGDVLIWPFRIPDKLYRLFLDGANFFVMPSFYEPFGAATEGFLHGAPVVARATGGLVTQVRSADPVTVPGSGFSVLDAGPIVSVDPDGFLFREAYDAYNIVDQWRQIFASLPGDRVAVPLYAAMVDAAVSALESAMAAYAEPHRYGELLINGAEALTRFSWDNAVARYRRVYSCCARHPV